LKILFANGSAAYQIVRTLKKQYPSLTGASVVEAAARIVVSAIARETDRP
jgi:nitrous oxidase accessory protein NosD